MTLSRPAWILSCILALALGAVFGAAGIVYAFTGDQPPADAHCVEVPVFGVWICGTLEEEPPPTTTTTTVPETTTTTAPPTTTTTAPPTTTTTTASGLVIPATLPYDTQGFKDNESFNFMIGCIDDVDRDGTVLLDCDLNSDGRLEHASFEYIGHGMPYLYPEGDEGTHGHAWWVAGDREGYRCGYAFMYDQHPNPFGMFSEPRPAEFIARATIVRPDGTGYGKLNDRYMDEGVRYYDGSIANEGGAEISEDCQQTSLDDFDYDAYVPVGAQDIRVGLFRADGEIGDIRDFTDVDVAVDSAGDPMGHFEFVGLKDGRVTIVFILEQNQKVSHVFYYDVMNTGRIAVEVDGVKVAEG